MAKMVNLDTIFTPLELGGEIAQKGVNFAKGGEIAKTPSSRSDRRGSYRTVAARQRGVRGKLTSKATIEANAFSQSAIAAIEAVGGSAVKL